MAVKRLADIVIDAMTKPFDLERIRRQVHEAIGELQSLRSSTARILVDKVLADGVPTPISHGLGRRVFVTHSPPRGAVSTGRIEEVRDGSYKDDKFVVLLATGWGADITVDLEVK